MHHKSKVIAMVGVMLAIFLAALDQTIVATAMPQIVKEFQGLEHLSWVFSAYMLASTVTIPIYGKLSDIYGRRVFFVAGIIIFMAGSIMSGQSHSMFQLILFRAFQGIGGGAIMVNAIAIIGDLFTPAERGRWQGLIGGVFGIASVAGPLVGGWLTDNISWRWIFYINVPFGILALAVLIIALPKIRTEAVRRSIDFPGAITLGLALISLLLAFVWGGSQYAWGSTQIIGLFAATALLLAIFALIESRAEDPVLPLGLFANRGLNISVIVTFLTSFGMFGAIVFIPLYAQSVVGFSATNSGLVLAPLSVGIIISSGIVGQIISRTGKYKLSSIVGLAIAVAGMYLFSRLAVDTTKLALVRDMVILGLGIGVSFPIYTIVVQSSFDRSKLGIATATIQLFRSIGSTVGVAIMGSLMNNALTDHLANVDSDPFVQTINRMNPAAAISGIDTNTLQNFLSADGQQRMVGLIENVPAPQQAQVQEYYLQFIQTLKEALAGSISHVYTLGVFVIIAAFLTTFFLPVIDLHRARKRPPVQELGVELEAEMALAEPRDEPEL
ncbi:MAG: MFS transporter [Thermoleophilia bacterium]|nr:MFS transporter [Thermoleophilia bacterium]